MTHDPEDEKQHAHDLIEQLPPRQLAAVVGLLEAMIDPVARKLRPRPSTMSRRMKTNAPPLRRRKSGCGGTGAKAFLMS